MVASRREVLWALLALVLATALELTLARADLPVGAVRVALVGLAVGKAAVIALVFMHLRHETRALRVTVFGPLAAPALYGLVLVADAAWRFLR